MKASLLRKALACLLLPGIALAAAASASQWQRLRPAGSEPTSAGRHMPTVREAYRLAHGINPSQGKVMPEGPEIISTPRVNQRPTSELRSPAAPRGNVFAVVNRHSEMTYATEAFVGHLNLVNGELTALNFSPIWCPYLGDDYIYQANTYRQGQIIAPHSYTGGVGNDSYEVGWTLVNAETFAEEGEISFGFEKLADPYQMTYDSDKDVFYCISLGNDGDSNLIMVDPKNNWRITEIGWIGNKGFIAALAYNPKDKQLYAFNAFNEVYVVNTRDCALEEVGYIDLEGGYFLFSDKVGGQIVYSPTDQAFVSIFRDNSLQATRLVFIDDETFEGTFGRTVHAVNAGEPYISALYCTDDFADADAPEIAPIPVADFDKASLAGTLTVTAPEFTFVGVDLSGKALDAKVTLDGNVIYDGTLNAGASKKFDLTLDEGLHNVEFTTAIGSKVSPMRSFAFYTGNDNPRAVENLKLFTGTLTWDPCGDLGDHNGYVDAAAVTYDVYLNGVKMNTAPLTGCEFSIPTDNVQMSVSDIDVIATANGKSSPKASISEIFGQAYTLPFAMAPSREERQLITIYNNNNDVRKFFFTDKPLETGGVDQTQHYGMAFTTGYAKDADDWIMLPAINFPSADNVYTFDFDISGVFTEPTQESYEIYVSKYPGVEGLLSGINILSDHEYAASVNWEHKSQNFAVPEAGDYYIGIRCCSTRKQSSQGIFLHEFRVRQLSGTTSAIPGDPVATELTPGDFGETYVVAKIQLPVNDITGRPLPADSEVTMTMAYKNYSTQGKGHPGETIELSLDTNTDGMASFSFTPSNENGKGYTRTYQAYVGIDVPLCPQNITGIPSEDNLVFKLSWDAPGPRGENNGFVDPSDLTYNLYSLSGVTFVKFGSTRNTSINVDPFAGNTPKQANFHMGPSAENSAGESRNSVMAADMIGKPYDVPVYEKWGTSKFNYMPYIFETKNGCQGSFWENVGSLAGLGVEALDYETLTEGGLLGYMQTGAPGQARLKLPKISTKGISKANFILRFLDYSKAPEKIDLYGRRHGHEELEYIGSYNLTQPAVPEWREEEIALPEAYLNCSWVQLQVGANLTGTDGENIILDTYQVFPDSEYDLKITEFEGPETISIGDTPTYKVTVANSGRERQGGSLSLELVDKNNNVLASSLEEIPVLAANQYFEASKTFDIDGSYLGHEGLAFRAVVENDLDHDLTNNERTLAIRMMGSTLPVVTDLAGTMGDAKVDLKWSTPSNEFGHFENFEAHVPFRNADKLDYWTNIDADGLVPVPVVITDNVGMIWDGWQQPSGWTVVNMETLGFMYDEKIAPHSGKQVLYARPGYYNEIEGQDPIQSSKWLVSPRIQGGTQLSFWVTIFTPTYKEYFEVWYNETDDPTRFDHEKASISRNGTWKRLQANHKSGEQAWEQVVYNLPEKAKYFAIRYDSFDGCGILIDDIEFTPAEMMKREAVSYSLYRADNGGEPKLVKSGITGTTFTDDTWNDQKSIYYITAHAMVDGQLVEGPQSNLINILGSSVNELNALRKVEGLNGEILIKGYAGIDYVIATPDGKVAAKASARSDAHRHTVAPAIYIVTIGRESFKIQVK